MMVLDDNIDKWFYPEVLTEQEKQMGVQLREQLQAKGVLLSTSDDLTLLRFLKARGWNMAQAVSMYKAMATWRQEYKVDELYQTYDFPELKELVMAYPHFYHKVDKSGRPVYIELLGKTDVASMMNITTVDRLLKYHTWTWERFEKQLLPSVSKLAKSPLLTQVVIVDLQGLSMKNFTITTQKVMSQIFKVDQDYYPEHLGVMFVINTPYLFKTIWSIISPWLEERTRRKIQVLGTDYHAALKSVIPEENLLTMYGGKSELPVNYTSVGPWMEEEPCKSCTWNPEGNVDKPKLLRGQA